MRRRRKKLPVDDHTSLEMVMGLVAMLQRIGVSNDQISSALLAGLALAHQSGS